MFLTLSFLNELNRRLKTICMLFYFSVLLWMQAYINTGRPLDLYICYVFMKLLSGVQQKFFRPDDSANTAGQHSSPAEWSTPHGLSISVPEPTSGESCIDASRHKTDSPTQQEELYVTSKPNVYTSYVSDIWIAPRITICDSFKWT